ncbi:Ig-like domain-containing protein [Patescibacteria group bacterium]|nr:Ig-like domain-containing protein [Patescibacteria group bacterium]
MPRYLIVLIILGAALTLTGCQSTSLTGQITSTITNNPRIVSFEPDHRTKGVALDAPIKITFDREMDQATLNTRNIGVEYAEDLGYNFNPLLNSKYEYDENSYLLTITPPENFQSQQKILITIREGITDKDGNELSAGDFYFTTGE